MAGCGRAFTRCRAVHAPVLRLCIAASIVKGVFLFAFRGWFVLQSARVENFHARCAVGRRGSSQVASVLSRRTGASRLIAP